jgi:hypothetical protein
MSGRIQGKICYMSPEQAAGKPVDRRSDIFSMGVVFYEMLTGERAFQGDSDLQSLDLVRRCEFAPPSSLNPDIPPELDVIVARALSREPAERYQSIDELHVALLEWLYGRGRAVTSQQLAGFVDALFPEGFERQELRRARDAASSSRSGAGGSSSAPLNLDDALNAEFAKLDGALTPGEAAAGTASAEIDPWSRTADKSDARAANLAHGRTATLQADLASGGADEAAAEGADESAASAEYSAERSAETGDEAEADANPDRADEAPAAAAPVEEARGFKRWMAVAMVLGVLIGGAILYFYAFIEYGTITVRTEPAGASIRVDGVKISGATTPHALELETGEHAIEVRKEGFVAQNFSVEVRPREKRVLEGGAISLRPLPEPEPDARPRHVWIAVAPPDASITINDGARVEVGQAKIEVSPGEQVLLEVSRAGCRTRSEVVTYREAIQGVELALECEGGSGDDAHGDLSEGSNEDARDPKASTPGDNRGSRANDARPRKPDPPAPRFKRITFVSEPPGAAMKVDGKPVRGPQRLEIGRSVQLSASLDGYKTHETTVEISRRLGPVYRVELQKVPIGCVLIRPTAGQQVEVLIDGKSFGRTSGARFDVATGVHEVELIWGDGTSSNYDVTVSSGDGCTGPLGFVRAETN